MDDEHITKAIEKYFLTADDDPETVILLSLLVKFFVSKDEWSYLEDHWHIQGDRIEVNEGVCEYCGELDRVFNWVSTEENKEYCLVCFKKMFFKGGD